MTECNIHTVTPDALAYGGAAVAGLPSGKRCFIRGGVPGDLLKIEIISDRKRFAIGRIREILEPAPERIESPCSLSGICPGCSYSCMKYPLELFWKQKQFEYFLKSVGVPADSIQDPVPAPKRLNWRNKIKLTRIGQTDGYLGEDNQSVFAVKHCALAEPAINDLLQCSSKFSGEAGRGGRRTLTFRYTKADGALYVDHSNRGKLLTWEPENIGGFYVPAGAFCQINTQAAGLLFQAFRHDMAEHPCKNFAELYCGSGIFSILARESGAEQSTGIELDADSIRTAEKNAELHDLDHCIFHCGDAWKEFRKIPQDADLLIDPPRTGLDPHLTTALAARKTGRLRYISCGPDTLARDLKTLIGGGWKVVSAQLFDLFPSTAHFESMTVLERS